ncbi:MAG: hypothetical protein CVV54_07040 [Synergistetes bacterium HGW-Synergistetes-1]|nr:MAG: hypothetical protein CVV54_07040 [Synergistetes bacterium HGW-Synergistetes-1]
MTNHKETLRLKSLGLTNTDIAATCTCGRNTVTLTLARVQENGLPWEKPALCRSSRSTQLT